MKKYFILIFVSIILAHGTEWYTSKQKVTDLTTRPELAQKDTAWYGYAPDLYYIWGPTEERATFFNVNDFGLEYPVNLHALTAYLYEGGYTYHYKIYDADGTTLLYETPDSISTYNYYDYFYFDTPLVLNDDFWVAAVPDPNAAGMPTSVSSSELTSTNSYIGNPTDGWNIHFDGTDYFEFENVVALSPYESWPPPPPSIRLVDGLENFMDSNADISVVVQGGGSIVSAAAEYSLDGGSSWTEYNITAVKGTEYFSGTIPGQPDGTSALTRFTFTDDADNILNSQDYTVNWSKDTPLLDESFEYEFPPDGWQLISNQGPDSASAGFVQASTVEGAFVKSGQSALTHWDDAGVQDDWAISPMLRLPADNSCTFMFWETGKWTNYYAFHEVAISTDGGLNWTQLYTGVASGDGEWANRVFSLRAYSGQDVWFGFHYTGDYSDQWFIDDVKVFYDYKPPVPVQLKGNDYLFEAGVIGAYVNNDMDLELTVTDESGVDSVKGHYYFPYMFAPVDVDLGYAGNDIWTVSIPEELSETAGEIWFDLYDTGGNSVTTDLYEIWFKEDSIPPLPPEVRGTFAFVNEPMQLNIKFYDESPVDSCYGHYSKDGWVTQYDFEMIPAKIHEYTYTGTIPAESEPVIKGEVRFTIVDASGNRIISENYEVQWLDGHTEIFEDFESGTDNWILTGNWGLEQGTYISETHALTESPGGDYTADNGSYAQWSQVIDLTNYLGADINFWCKYDIEEGFDYMHFEISDDGGSSWERIKTWSNEGADWDEENICLDGFAGKNAVLFRWYFESDGGYEVNGMYIDDIILNLYLSERPSHPYILHDGPIHYNGGSWHENYNSSAYIYDISGIDSARVYYQADNGPVEECEMILSEGDQWNFTIPPMTVGTLVKYWIWARDASVYQMESTEGYYYYISGDHLIYDSDITTYYMTAENNDAYAVRMSIEGSMHSQYVPFVLIKNYSDPTHVSDSMAVHIWYDNGGYPGEDIRDPVMILPDTGVSSHEYTKVDLRSDSNEPGPLAGVDFWVGLSAPSGTVFTQTEDAVEEGTTAYGRSYIGTWNGSGWSWYQQSEYNYLIRAVYGFTGNIEDNENIPVRSTLHQNYPNPFNPETTIEFGLAKDAEVALTVYDVRGRIVEKLIHRKMEAGKHVSRFDGSRYNSGVYFYRLNVDGKPQGCRKMLLIK